MTDKPDLNGDTMGDFNLQKRERQIVEAPSSPQLHKSVLGSSTLLRRMKLDKVGGWRLSWSLKYGRCLFPRDYP
jgi:hypothetical protein